MRRLTALMLAAILSVAPAPANAATSFWTGTVNNSWNNAGNWSPAGIPTSSLNTQLSFGAAVTTSITDNIAGTFILNQLTFGGPSYTLTGNLLDFRSNSSATLPSIVMNAANAVTISNPFTLTNNLTVNGARGRLRGA
jgi:hypothetical protein